jgi:hypothetical protein
MMPIDSGTLLLKELDEQNLRIRTNIQLLVQWFIFFATANYVVLGYFALKAVSDEIKSSGTFYWTAALFFAVNVLALVLCIRAVGIYRKAETAIAELYDLLWKSASPGEPPAYLHRPSSDYPTVAILMAICIGFIAATWLGFSYYMTTQ